MKLIRESVKSDVYSFYPTLQEKDKQEVLKIGYTPKSALYTAYKKGVYRRTGLIDGEVVAMWGLTGTLLSEVGHPYFLSGNSLKKMTTRDILDIYKYEVAVMHQFFPILENVVDASYTEAIRLLKLARFSIGEPFELNGNMFRQFIKAI